MLPERQILELLGTLEGEVGLYLEDLATGETFTVNPDRVFPSASVIKIPILAALFALAEEGKVDLAGEITIKPENRVGGCGVLSELNPGLKPTVLDVATLMIIQSDNAATNELIDLVGMDRVNGFAGELGLEQTRLQRKMMDSEAVKQGRDNFTSPRDIGRLLRLLVEGKVVSREASAKMLDIMKRQQLRNKLPALLPEDVIIAHKTGDLNRLEHDVGVFFLPEHTYILAIFTNC
ncbi:MAG TPA: serine hydrolase [Firmicutes bacterium]|nr:serine hydrolase [Bacillota bacterium]